MKVLRLAGEAAVKADAELHEAQEQVKKAQQELDEITKLFNSLPAGLILFLL